MLSPQQLHHSICTGTSDLISPRAADARCLLLFLVNSYPHVCVSILGIITLILFSSKMGK